MNSKIKILFVCHGNICRSAMAEYMMKKFAKDAGLSDCFEIDSAATSTEEIGNPVYPPARKKLAEHGIFSEGHRARQVKRSDYDYFDMIILMDKENTRHIKWIIPKDPEHKISMMMDYAADDYLSSKTGGRCYNFQIKKEPADRCESGGIFSRNSRIAGEIIEVADPWFTGDFESTWNDLEAGCRGLLEYCVRRY